MKTSQDEWRKLEQPNEATERPQGGACQTPRRSWHMLPLLALGIGGAAGAIVVMFGDSSMREGISYGAFFALTSFGGLLAARESSCGGCCLSRWFQRRGAQQGGDMTEHNA